MRSTTRGMVARAAAKPRVVIVGHRSGLGAANIGMSDGGRLVFRARIAEADGTETDALYYADGAGVASVIAMEGDAAPGFFGDAHFGVENGVLAMPSPNRRGPVLFRANLVGENAINDADGLFVYAPDSGLKKVVGSGDLLDLEGNRADVRTVLDDGDVDAADLNLVQGAFCGICGCAHLQQLPNSGMLRTSRSRERPCALVRAGGIPPSARSSAATAARCITIARVHTRREDADGWNTDRWNTDARPLRRRLRRLPVRVRRDGRHRHADSLHCSGGGQ